MNTDGVVVARDPGAVDGYMRAMTEHGVSDELTKGIGFLLHLTDVYMVQMAGMRFFAVELVYTCIALGSGLTCAPFVMFSRKSHPSLLLRRTVWVKFARMQLAPLTAHLAILLF